ncbi:MAG: L,D-transpeptidase family protein, partial [Candidatus Krumholzibacteria bacterium]|nr:L,D-transpeptidase family protein [Candidatus Krumholzibacteria bacterium]
MKANKVGSAVLAVLAFGSVVCYGFNNLDPIAEAERERLRNRLEIAKGPPELIVADQLIHCETTLRRFYHERGFAPAWTKGSGPTLHADSLVSVIEGARWEGLEPEDYHLTPIRTLLVRTRANARKKKAPDPRYLVDLELLLTDAFLLYGSHCLAGRLDPETIHSEWFATRREEDLARVLQSALDKSEIRPALQGLLPPQSGYMALKKGLLRYRKLAEAGGWPTVPEGPKLQLGDRGERVTALTKRLTVTGELSAPNDRSQDPLAFDQSVDQAVRLFQRHHGLDVDGVVGPATLAALNATAAQRVQQITVNLERWRWLPQDLGQHHILVNIADFGLEVLENGRSVLEMAVIVGRTYRRTPVFSATMTYLVFSPAWEVPPTLAVQDILPQIQADPSYLAQKGFKVLHGWGAQEREVDPTTLNWQEFSRSYFPYRLRQAPGPQNALGRVKFMFPNKFNVYLHDTPGRDLFAKSVRAFSSGCIRIEHPEALAQCLLACDPAWS